MQDVYVIFRYNKKEDDLFAFFPFVMWSSDIKQRSSYSHLGQHSSCHIDYAMKDCRKATKAEYASLLEELKTIGYNPIII